MNSDCFFSRHTFVRPATTLAAGLLVVSILACGGETSSSHDAAANTSDATFGVCGDGVIDGNDECDDGPLNSDSEPDA